MPNFMRAASSGLKKPRPRHRCQGRGPCENGRVDLIENASLASRTTLRVGGPAHWLVKARDEASVLDALDWAAAGGAAVRVLGGGSNVVVADEGVDALVLQVALRGVSVDAPGPARAGATEGAGAGGGRGAESG